MQRTKTEQRIVNLNDATEHKYSSDVHYMSIGITYYEVFYTMFE